MQFHGCWKVCLLLTPLGNWWASYSIFSCKTSEISQVQPCSTRGSSWWYLQEELEGKTSMISDRWFPCLLAISPNIPNFCWLIWSGDSKNGHAQNCTPEFFLSDRFFFSWFSWAIPNHPKAIFQIHGLYMFTLWLFNIALENHHAIGKPSMSMGHLYHGYVK